jgi:hypothetical protein
MKFHKGLARECALAARRASSCSISKRGLIETILLRRNEMQKRLFTIGMIVAAGLVVVTAAESVDTYAPGMRIQVLSHNAFPDQGQYADRLDRAISAGVPFSVEGSRLGRRPLTADPRSEGGGHR